MKMPKRRWWLAAAAPAVAAAAVLATVAPGASATSARPGGLGPISGLLPRTQLTEESAIQVNLSKETVRLPLYPGRRTRARRRRRRSGTCCWTPPTPGWRTTWA